MPRNSKTAAASGTAALPQLTKQMLEELIPGPVTKEQFTDIFENFKKNQRFDPAGLTSRNKPAES